MTRHGQDVQLDCEIAGFLICYDLDLKMSPEGSCVKGLATIGRWWRLQGVRPGKSCQDDRIPLGFLAGRRRTALPEPAHLPQWSADSPQAPEHPGQVILDLRCVS